MESYRLTNYNDSMEAVFTKLIEQLNSSVFILLVILGIAFYFIFLFGKWSQKFLHHEDKINNFQGLSDKIIELKTKVDLIYQNTNPNKLVASHSPISLTEMGKAMADTINADKILSEHIDSLVKEVELDAPKNAYDIQVVSMKVAKEKLLSYLNENNLNAIKDEAYAKGILVEDIMTIFGVLLRNQILKNKGIPISDVDVHSNGKD